MTDKWYIGKFMLALDLGKIRVADEHFEQAFLPGVLGETGDNYRVTAPVTLVFDIHKDKQQFRLVGRVQTTLELECSRCVEPFAWPVNTQFDLTYQPQIVNTGEGDRAIAEDDLTTAYYEHDEIDLGQLMREQFYLSLPMKPLCAVGCHGLCPVCGTNLNLGTCACERQWEDPRLAALKSLQATKRES